MFRNNFGNFNNDRNNSQNRPDENTPYQPSGNERQNNYFLRSFRQGREADGDVTEQCHSLNDQRTFVNRQHSKPQGRGKGRFNNRRNQRGYFRRNNSRGCVSDTENMSSHKSQSVKSNDGIWGDTALPEDMRNKPNPNAQNIYQRFSSQEGIESNVKISNKKFAEESSRSETDPNLNVQRQDKLSALKQSRKNYEDLLKSLDPMEVVMDCRQDVEDTAKKAIKHNFKKIEMITEQIETLKKMEVISKQVGTREIFKLHLQNLVEQQRQFEDYIANVKSQLSSIYTSDVQNLLKSSEGIKGKVENECKLFKRSFAGYAFKGQLMDKIKNNKVVIVSADSVYLLNILLPIFAKNAYPNHTIVSCETTPILVERTKQNVMNLIQDNFDGKNTQDCPNFATEEEVIGLFSSDYTFGEKNIFGIIHLSLKRSLTMDNVLADFKDLLLDHEESKLVLVVSMRDQISKYELFFSDQMIKVDVIKTPSLILPVKTVWKNSALLPVDDYIEEVAKTALAIHSLNEEGDVMAFLPTFADIKSVSVSINEKLINFQYDNLVCDIIHDSSTNKSCLDLSYKQQSKKRKVFLVTDCAEMIIIPTVRFVIDCGLRKDHLYDTSKKLDVLTTTFVSRAKAKLRRRLAGAFLSSGICYRLYNKENYLKEMPKVEYPELLTVNPFNSLIKIFQHRPNTATSVDFVDCLPKSTKENALKMLKKYNAVKNDVLTALGRNMIKLPFPPKYSKLILLGIQWGLAYEAVILVAFFSVKGRVFHYSPDSQTDTDAVKLQLMQGDSDTLSYLHIYKAWVENECSDSWCKEHRINYSTMDSVQKKVHEICETVGKALNENISREFCNLSKSTLHILEMIFDCFHDNLCVFTGHYKSGYRVLSSHCIAFVHPSSVICQKEDLPQFIIFDHMVSTNRDFLISLTSIPPDFVMKALTDQTIEFDYSDMFEKSLVLKTIEPIGERMIKQVLLGKKGGKLKVIENHIKSILSTESFVIEPVPEKGRISVYALEPQIDEAVSLVKDVLTKQFDEIMNSEKIDTLELKRGQVTIPVEIKWLKGGSVVSVKTGTTPQNIQNDFEADEENSEQLPCVIQRCINVTWIRRPCNGRGYITFSANDFPTARRLAMRSITLSQNVLIFVQLSRDVPNQLYLTEIPEETKPADIKEVFSRLLKNVSIEKVELIYRPPFETSQNELQEIKVKLEGLCGSVTDLSVTDVNVKIPPPKNSATVFKAYINVTEEEDIDTAAESLSKCKILDRQLTCRPVYRSVIKCSLKVCEALQERFVNTLRELQADLRETYNEQDLFELTINKVNDDMADIKMVSNKCQVLQTLQRATNHLLEGEVLDRKFSNKLNKMFCHGGGLWLKNLEKTSKVTILEDYVNKTLRLYGSKESCRFCKHRITEYLEEAETEAVHFVSLSGDSKKRKLMKGLLKNYGVNLEQFIETCELRSAVLEIKSCMLSLHGSRESIELAEEKLRELAVEIISDNASNVIMDGELCPVCACSAFNGTRLELCGHLYCSECIEGLVEQAQFPLQCCAEECFKDIILDDISKILSDDPVRIRRLLEKSMKHYIEARRDEIFYCPSPDCSMFFYKNEVSSDKINCALCQNDICVKCNVVFHQGLSCEMYQGSKNDPDYSFKVWQQASTECKRCPKCASAIQKNGGCDHMTCRSCSAHFCWQCVREFANADEVYRHLPFCDHYPR